MAPTKKSDEMQHDELEAAKAREDQMLTMLAEMQERLDSLESAAAAAPEVGTRSAIEAELDAELESLKEEFAGYEQIQVFENRVVLGQEAGSDIRLKEDPSAFDDPVGQKRYWKLRWFNTAKENRAEQARHEGYSKVLWDELQDDGMVPSGTRTDAFVRRGERGAELLHKIPMKLYVYKLKRDAARRSGQLQSESFVRDHVANNVARMAGKDGDNASQAGDFAHGQMTMTVTPAAREVVTL